MTVSQAEIRALRHELNQAGVFERRATQTTLKLLFFLVTAGTLIALTTMVPLWGVALLLPPTAFFLAAAAMVGHEGGHRSFSTKTAANETLYHLLFPLMGGLGAMQWKDKHNVRHHGHPNVVDVDDDMELWPLAHNREAYLASGRARRFVQRHAQHWLWWPITMLFSWSIKVDSIGFLIRSAKKNGITRTWLLDLAMQLGHYALWLVVPSFIWGFGAVFAYYLALFALVSLMLALVFAPGHMGLPIRHDHPDGWLLQLETTRNLALPRWLSFFFIGLDHQIEHHLFPKIPHANLPRAAAIVRPWVEARGLPYHRLPYLTALKVVTRYVRDAWRYDAVPVGGPAFASPPVSQAHRIGQDAPRVEPTANTTSNEAPLTARERLAACITNAPARSA